MTEERKRLLMIAGAVAAVLVLVGAVFGIRAIVGDDGDSPTNASAEGPGNGDADSEGNGGQDAESGNGDAPGEGDAAPECEQFLCDDDGNVVIGLDGNPVRLGPDGQPIVVGSDGQPIVFDGPIFGRPIPPTPPDDPPDGPGEEELRRAYADAFRATCTAIWAISPTGVLFDPFDFDPYTVNDCLDEMDETWADLADSPAEAAELGREDANDAADFLTMDGRLCWEDTCWQHPDY
jgi:hypothetical protein